MLKWIPIVAVGLLALVFVIFQMQGPVDLYLVATDVVPIYQSENDAARLPTSATNRKLVPFNRVHVVECIDVKHYLIYKVQFPDGTYGYVNDGKYVLERKGVVASC